MGIKAPKLIGVKLTVLSGWTAKDVILKLLI
jgi:aconitase A